MQTKPVKKKIRKKKGIEVEEKASQVIPTMTNMVLVFRSDKIKVLLYMLNIINAENKGYNIRQYSDCGL